MQEPEDKDDELVINRVFQASPEKVWKMWCECEQVMRWWGPKGFTSPSCRMDFRPGGKVVFCMRAPKEQGGADYYSTGVYREIIPLEKIVVTDCFSDEQGNVVPASYYGMEGDYPLELLVTIRFEDLKGRTRMTLKHSGLPAGNLLDQTRTSWQETFDKLDAALAGQA